MVIGEGITLTGAQIIGPIWENASPTSAFAAQTVALDLSGYSSVVIVFTGEQGNGRRMEQAEVGGSQFASNFITIASGTVYSKQRLYTVSATGVTFQNNYESGTSNPNNAQNVPVRIFGIKGVASA